MRVSKNSIVSMCYSMIGDNGEVIDESPRTEPFEFFCGAGQLVPGLERQLIGLRAGEHKEFSVAPADAYGEHNATLVSAWLVVSCPVPSTLKRECGSQCALPKVLSWYAESLRYKTRR